MKSQGEEYEGHHIDIKGSKDQPELLIDDVPVAYGRMPDGSYFLDDYPYDWTDDLRELARRYIAHQQRVKEVRAAAAARRDK